MPFTDKEQAKVALKDAMIKLNTDPLKSQLLEISLENKAADGDSPEVTAEKKQKEEGRVSQSSSTHSFVSH